MVGLSLVRDLLLPQRLLRAMGQCMRLSSSFKGCQEDLDSRCKKTGTRSPCGQPKLQRKKPKPKPKQKFKSMWLNPFCDAHEPHCPFNPRFDDIYYVESDKAKRRYWQTWTSCPPMKLKEKKICCFERARGPPMKRRKHRKPKTACEPPSCPDPDSLDCPKFKRRCHKKGRIPPSCIVYPSPSDCRKPLTPYPSFSECRRLKPGALPLSECGCCKTPMMCEAWAEFRLRALRKK
ncbi:uncharacterized protein LOC117585536 [Drosophila guanche]|uniref:Uncharacterized protein n=1 Tax=Drosophila guanche TaxID=7266 RepID=A0A3B0JM37_DROGU|nr:uncharacterized protein LOC117585536 [Drosophila guanche]SPP83317.1 Hypothetical predicted protein [Drosophila guanche]